MINAPLESLNLVSAINSLIDQKLDELYVATFAVVTMVNTKKHTINAQPLVAKAVKTKKKSEFIAPAEIKNIPFILSTTPQVGDYCVLLHLDQSINSGRFNILKRLLFNTSAGTYVNFISSRGKSHRYDSCVAICCFARGTLDADTVVETWKQIRNTGLSINHGLLEERIKQLEMRVNILENTLNTRMTTFNTHTHSLSGIAFTGTSSAGPITGTITTGTTQSSSGTYKDVTVADPAGSKIWDEGTV